MALTVAALTTINDNTLASTYASATYAPTANRLLLAFFGGVGTQLDPTSVTGNGVTWAKVAAQNNAINIRINLWAALSGSSPSNAAFTVNYASNQQSQHASVFEVNGANLSLGAVGAVIQFPGNNGTATSGSVTLAAPVHGANRPFVAFMHPANEGSIERTYWSEIHDVGTAEPSCLETQWRSSLFETTASATWSSNSAWCGLAAEIQAGAGTITTDLVTISTADSTSAQGTWDKIAGTSSANPSADADGKIEGVASLANKLGSTVTPTDVGGSCVLTSTFDSSGKHFFHWRAITTPQNMNNKSAQGVVVHLSSDVSAPGSSNYKRWFIEGGDTDVLGGWKSYVIDPAGTADATAGTLTLTAIKTLVFVCRQATAVQTTLFNHAVDAVRQGTGLTLIYGNGQTPATLEDIYLTDSSQLYGWGVVGKVGGVYFADGKINIGTTGQTSETIFLDKGQTLLWKDYNVASGFYEIVVVGAAGQKTTFQLGTYTPASDLASSGCVIKGAGNVSGASRLDGVAGLAHSIWRLTASDANQVTKLYACNFSEMIDAALAYNAVSIELTTNCTTTNNQPTLTTTDSFHTNGIAVGMKITGTNIPTNTYVSSIQSATSLTMDKNATGSGSSLTMTFTHNNEMRYCTFSNFGAITTNGCVIDNCTFQDVKTGAPISSTFGLIVNSATEMSRITNTKLVNCNRAIRITATGTYAFDNITFSGNVYDIENSSAGLVTINATNGANPVTSINTGGGSTTINNAVTLNVTVKNEAGTAIQNAQVGIFKTSDGTQLMNELTNVSGLATESFNYTIDIAVNVRVRKGTGGTTKYFPVESPQTITVNGLNLTITLIEDTINTS